MRHPLVAALALVLLAAAPVRAQERDAGEDYYHPPVSSEERFDRKITVGPPATRDSRVNFVTFITKAQLAAPESPRFVFFAKGGEADRLHLVALDDEVFRTIYRARAVMAQMTSNFRGTEFFAQQGLTTVGTFYDMLQLLGFESLTITDGATWTHRVHFD